MEIKKIESETPVYIVTYTHKHGTDVWVTSTNKRAEESIGRTILEYIEDVLRVDSKKKIKTLISEGKHLEASSEWFEQTEEWFEIIKRNVDE